MTGRALIPSRSPRVAARPDRAAGRPLLAGLGFATPEREVTTPEMREVLTRLWGLTGADVARFRRITERSGVDRRGIVMRPDEVIGLGTGDRMAAYERLAPPLACAAADAALGDAGVDAARVTDLVIVSCTGFSAPGLDVELVRQLGLSDRVRRTVVGFMGCFGAIIGLRTARSACADDRSAVALVVCLELCSLHVRADPAVDNQVASTLFADGAAAAVVTGRMAGARGASAVRGAVSRGDSRLIGDGADLMSWRISDHGFAMRLSPDVPAALREALRDEDVAPMTPVVHPGGPRIIDAVAAAMGPAADRAIACSRAVLRRHGNMSSASVLFVLDAVGRAGLPRPARLLAFGPGLSLESIEITDA